MGNSIEEDIKIVENYLAHSAINETDSDFFKNGGWETVDLEIPKSMQHILLDYKRVLKENEIYKKNSEIMSKENLSTAKQLKVEIKENFRLKNQLENNRKEYQETYKDVREELKELKKENEELKIIKSAIQTLQINSLEEEKYIVISKGSFLGGSYKHLLDDYIPVQKVKDIIEELKKQDKEWTEELSEPDSNFKNIDRNLKRIKNQTEVLKGLLESEEN